MLRDPQPGQGLSHFPIALPPSSPGCSCTLLFTSSTLIHSLGAVLWGIRKAVRAGSGREGQRIGRCESLWWLCLLGPPIVLGPLAGICPESPSPHMLPFRNVLTHVATDIRGRPAPACLCWSQGADPLGLSAIAVPSAYSLISLASQSS